MAWLGVFILCVFCVWGLWACPDGCTCRPANDCTGTYVNCLNKGLTTVPTNIPKDTCRLYLRSNAITTVEKGSFEGLTNLVYLDLEGNAITVVEKRSFEGLTNLLFLDLSFNKITMVETASFEGLTNLTTLDLRFNAITTVEKGSFEGLTNLVSLYLTNNKITMVERGNFDGLVNLKKLDLENNLLQSVSKDLVDGLTKLERLYLTDNNITMVERGSFDGLVNLKELDLENNLLQSVSKDLVDGLTKLKRLALENNPLHCDCQLVAFLAVAKSRSIRLKYDDNIEPSCRTPRKLNGTLLKNLPLQEMTRNCTLKTTTVTPIAVQTNVVSTTLVLTSTSVSKTSTSVSTTVISVSTKDTSDVRDPEGKLPGGGIFLNIYLEHNFSILLICFNYKKHLVPSVSHIQRLFTVVMVSIVVNYRHTKLAISLVFFH